MYHETECGCRQHGQGGRFGMGYGGEWGHHDYRGWGRMHHGGGRWFYGCDCGCHQSGFDHEFMHRRFISKEEVIAKLEEYLKQLQAEAKAVEERLAELKESQT